MPKKIDPKVKARCIAQLVEHLPEYPNVTAAIEAVGRRNGVSSESVRRWHTQSLVDRGERGLYHKRCNWSS